MSVFSTVSFPLSDTLLVFQCRLAALLVLCSLLEGSRPYLAAADDKFACGTLSFTPFSCRLGAVLRELHHQLLLALTTETHTVILTRAVRCLALLVANTPYQQLSPGYLGRVISTLHSLTGHKGRAHLTSHTLTSHFSLLTLTSHISHLTPSLLTRSHLTPSHLTCHISPVTSHTSHITSHF